MEKSKVEWTHYTNEAKDDAEPYCGECDAALEEEWQYCPFCGIELEWEGERLYIEMTEVSADEFFAKKLIKEAQNDVCI